MNSWIPEDKMLFEALLAAFPKSSELAMAVRISLGVNLEEIGAGNLRDLTFSLVEWAVAQNRRDDVRRMLSSRRDNVSRLRPNSPPCNLPKYVSPPFVGRQDELEEITSILAREEGVILILAGPSGVGKTRLAVEVGRRVLDQFDGGVFFVNMRVDPIGDLARIASRLAASSVGLEPPRDQAARLLATIGERRSLLIYDDVPDRVTLSEEILPSLGRCAVLVTTTYAYWPAGFNSVRIGALTHQDADALIDAMIRSEDARQRCREGVLRRAEGVTVQLVAEARAVDYESSHSRTGTLSERPSTEAHTSFERAWSLLDHSARLWLRCAAYFRADRTSLHRPAEWLKRVGWDSHKIWRAVDAVTDRFLVEVFGSEYRLHTLVLDFVRQQTEPQVSEADVLALMGEFIVAVEWFLAHATEPEVRQRLLDFELDVAFWEKLGVLAGDDRVTPRKVGNCLIEAGRFAEAQAWSERAANIESHSDECDWDSLGWDLHAVAYCLMEQGQFDEARRWFERAVEAKQRGDVHGDVDHDNVGRSMHRVGYCLFMQEQYESAVAWFERAIREKEFGDRAHKVQHTSGAWSLYMLGLCRMKELMFSDALDLLERAFGEASLSLENHPVDQGLIAKCTRQVGLCLAELGRAEESLDWFLRSIEAAKRGDFLGRIDYELIGANMAHVGDCFVVRGDSAEALRWYEQSVSAKRRGDVFGRVDAESLGESLLCAGKVLLHRGDLPAALSTFQEAAITSARGDRWGRSDQQLVHRSLEAADQALKAFARNDGGTNID